MTSTAEDILYELLPAIYRIRDAEQGHPLRALLRAIAAQLAEITADIARQYDNWFIETCDDELVPYFAQLVGLQLGPTLDSGVDVSTLAADATWRRRQVANAIADRRRKGSFTVVAAVAGDATGWPALAIEIGRRLLGAQSVTLPDVGRRPLPAIAAGFGDPAAPLADLSPLADVRRLSSHRTRSTGNPTGVAVWLWRLVGDGVHRAPAAALGDDGRFACDQLGRDVALCVATAGPPAGRPVADELDVPTAITRSAMADRIEDYYGPGRSLSLYRGGRLIPRDEVLVADLREWRGRTPAGFVRVDPELGRIAFPARDEPHDGVEVSYSRLSIGAIGGGSYQRRLAPVAEAEHYTVGRGRGTAHRTVRGALDAWRAVKQSHAAPHAVIEIADDGVYEEHFDIRLAAGESLQIRAAQGRRPVLVPTKARSNRPDELRISGTGKPEAEVPAADPPVLTLDGIWIAGHAVLLEGAFAGARLRHCTLVPRARPWGDEARVESRDHDRPEGHPASLIVRGTPCPVSIIGSVSGPIRIDSAEAGDDPIVVAVADSILDAGGPDQRAVTAADHRRAFATVALQRVTVLGAVHVEAAELIEDSIVTGELACERRQTGTIRFSYIRPGSRTPRRTSCQPDDALAEIEDRIARGELPAAHRERARRVIEGRLHPRFDAVAFGAPAYGRLVADGPAQLTGGAHDEGELGAYHNLWETLRISDLRARLQEFMPVGFDFDIRFAS
jgi:hypothetical protein